jgi:hypothetical protein
VLRNPYSEVRGVNSSCFSTRAASRRIGFFDRDGFKRILGNMLPSGFGSLRLYGFHPGLTQFLSNAFLIEPMSSSERGGRRGAEGRPRTEGIPPPRGLEPGSLRFRDDHLHIGLTGARSPEPSLVLSRRFWFWFGFCGADENRNPACDWPRLFC